MKRVDAISAPIMEKLLAGEPVLIEGKYYLIDHFMMKEVPKPESKGEAS